VDDPTGKTIEPTLQNPNVLIPGNLTVDGTITGTITASPPTQLATDTTPVTINTTHPGGVNNVLVSTNATNATWQGLSTLTVGNASTAALATLASNSLALNGVTPDNNAGTAGNVLVALSSSAAHWQTNAPNAVNAQTANAIALGKGVLINTGTSTTLNTTAATGTILIGQGAGNIPIFSITPVTSGWLLSSTSSTTAPTYVDPSTVTVGTATNATNATSATNATNATNLLVGTTGQMPIQNGTPTTGFIAAGVPGSVLVWGASVPSFQLIPRPTITKFTTGTTQNYTPPRS